MSYMTAQFQLVLQPPEITILMGADWRSLLGYEFSTIDIVDVFPVS